MYRNTILVTRPAGVQWFRDADPDTHSGYQTWLQSQPGFISNESVSPTDDELTVTQLWESQAQFYAMKSQQALRAEFQSKKAYEAQVGITATVIFRGDV